MPSINMNVHMTTTHLVVAGAAAAASALLITLYFKTKSKKRNWVAVSKVKNLIIYPVKSCRGVEVKRIQVSRNGIRFEDFRDRSWMLVDADGTAIHQRNEPSLVLVTPSFHNEDELWIDAKGKPTLKLKIKEEFLPSDVVVNTKIWGTTAQGVDCGVEASQWFSSYLGRPGIRLIQHLPELPNRKSNIVYHNQIVEDRRFPIIYQDGSSILLVNEKSLEDLNRRLPENEKVSYRNFRANVVVGDCLAYSEDNWKYVQMGDVELKALKPCERCTMVTVNPETGKKGKEPLETLRSYRCAKTPEEKKLYKNAPLFGLNLGPETRGEIRVGDECLVDVALNE